VSASAGQLRQAASQDVGAQAGWEEAIGWQAVTRFLPSYGYVVYVDRILKEVSELILH
jgi:hypothetical protein